MENLSGFALALGRFISFIFITTYEIAGLYRPFVRGVSREKDFMFRAQRWAKRALRFFGVHIRCEGMIPLSPAIFVSNHRSYIDILVLASLYPSFFLAKREVASWPLIGTAAKLSGVLFVRRESRKSRQRAKSAMVERVQRGHSVTLFPEGTTTAGPRFAPFLPGVFYLSARRGIPIVPISLEYERPEDAWIGEGSLLSHFFKSFSRKTQIVDVCVGPRLSHADGESLHLLATGWIADRLYQRHKKEASYETKLPIRISLPTIALLKAGGDKETEWGIA